MSFLFSKQIDKEKNNVTVKILGIKFKYTPKGSNNKIYLEENGVLKEVRKIKGAKIKLRGNNNTVIIGKPYHLEDVIIHIIGDNNKVIIEKSEHYIRHTEIWMNARQGLKNRTVHIKKNCSMESTTIQVTPNNASLTIGEECMFSFRLNIFTGDGHQITDRTTGEIMSQNSSVEIGDHVWIGHDVSIGKNVKIPSNSIIGFNSVVTKKFEEEYTAIAGNPAKVIKRNIVWDRNMDF